MVADRHFSPRDGAPPATARRRFAVLLYCARSGSTFFAHRLAQSDPRLAVTPEFRLPLLLFWKGEARVQAMDGAALLDLIRDDVQFGNLAIAQDALPALAQALAGGSIRDVLEGVVDAHLRGLGREGVEQVVLKNASFAHNAAAARAAFPEMRGIHVVRDPRGAASSMIRTPSPYDDDRPMAHGDIVHAAKLWSDYIDLVETLDWPVREVRYETLVEAPEATAAEIAGWLLEGAREAETGTATEDRPKPDVAAAPPPQATFEVGAAERGIHRHVAGAGLAERAAAWEAELEPWRRLAVEAVAGERMSRRGYAWSAGAQAAPRLSLRARATYLANETRHYLRSTARLVRWAATEPRTARIRLRQFVARIRGRY